MSTLEIRYEVSNVMELMSKQSEVISEHQGPLIAASELSHSKTYKECLGFLEVFPFSCVEQAVE